MKKKPTRVNQQWYNGPTKCDNTWDNASVKK